MDALQGCSGSTLGIWAGFLLVLAAVFLLDRRARGFGGFAPAAAVFVILGWILRDRSYLLADSRLWIHTVQAMGAEAPPHRSPLATRIMIWIGGPTDPAPLLALLSIFSGVAAILGLWWGMAAGKRDMSPGSPDRGPGPLVFAALLFLQPMSFIFYGHVESYPLLAVTLVWFLAAVRRDRMRGRLSPWTPILLLIAGFTHYVCVLILPALLAWIWSGRRESGMVWRFALLAAVLGGAGLFIPGVSRYMLWNQGWTGMELAAYAGDVLNAWLLVLWVPGVVWLATGRRFLKDGTARFLFLLGGSFLALPFIGAFELGMYRDLDLLTPAWITFTFLAAHVWRREGLPRRKMLAAAWIPGTLLLASMLALTFCPRGPAVVERHIDENVMTKRGRVYGYEVLAFAAQERGEMLEVEHYLRDAIRLNPGNNRLYGPLGEIQLALGDTLGALESLRTSMDSPRARKSGPLLAEVLARLGRPQETIQILEADRRAAMASSKAAAALAVAYFQVGAPDSMIAVSRDRLRVDPEDHVALFNLASGLSALDRYREAEEALRQAAALAPDRIPYHRALVQLLLRKPGGQDEVRLYLSGLDPKIADQVMR